MAEKNTIYEIPVSEISVDTANNVRRTEVDKDLDELAASIKKHGLLQPVLLRGEFGKPRYKLIVGQRRYRAHKVLGKKTIRATFAGKLTDVQASIRSLAENMHRVELNHADAARAVTALYKQFGRNDRRVARETGMSLTTVRRYIYVKERASDHALQLLEERKVSLLDVKRVLDAAQGNIQKADGLLDKIIEMTGEEKKRLSLYAIEHPAAPLREIIREAQKPRIQHRLSVDLTLPVRKALGKAERALNMRAGDIAAQALEEWLEEKGFIR